MPRSFTELDAWKLSKDLQRTVLGFLERPRLACNFKLRDQVDDAASSAPRNIAEGHGRFERVEFAQFLKVALGSLAETQNHVIDLCDRGIITAAERDGCLQMAKRAIAATTGLRAYLLSDRNQVSNKRTFKPREPTPKNPEPS
jgi:four helix bundle protein